MPATQELEQVLESNTIWATLHNTNVHLRSFGLLSKQHCPASTFGSDTVFEKHKRTEQNM